MTGAADGTIRTFDARSGSCVHVLTLERRRGQTIVWRVHVLPYVLCCIVLSRVFSFLHVVAVSVSVLGSSRACYRVVARVNIAG